MNALIVDDERLHLTPVLQILESISLIKRIDTAPSYAMASHHLSQRLYDIAILDIRLQDRKDGIDLCKQIRHAQPNTIVFLITGFNTLSTLKAAYEAGCFDYLQKPVSRVELKLKTLRWIERESVKRTKNKQLVYQGLSFDFDNAQFFYFGKPIKLSKSCKRLLFILIKTPEKLVTHQEIQKQLWGDHDCSMKKRDISERIRSLRRQLPDEVAAWVKSIVGEGYIVTTKKPYLNGK